jgi:hypothetical protein
MIGAVLNDRFELVCAEARHISGVLPKHISDISPKEIAMFKIAVVVFALAVSGFMLWIAHENANFAQLPHATFLKRAA